MSEWQTVQNEKVEAPQTKRSDGMTPLHIAAMHDKVDELKRLMAKGDDTNAKDQWSRTPLHLAVANNNVASVSALVAANATSLSEWDDEGRTPLLCAVAQRLHAVVDALINGFEASGQQEAINATGRLGQTAAHLAVSRSDVKVLNVLIAAGSNLDIGDLDGNRPIHYAACGCITSTELLVRAGIDLDVCNNDGDNPLILATKNHGREIAAALVSAGAAVNVAGTDAYHWTALHWAAFNEDAESILCLRRAGANLKAEDGKGKTPMDLAVVSSKGIADTPSVLALKP